MITQKELYELRAILKAQNHMINEIEKSLDIISKSFEDVDEQKREILELQEIMDEIENKSSLLVTSDIEDWDDSKIKDLYQERSNKVKIELLSLNYHNWSQFVRDCQAYCHIKNIDSTMPWETMLTEEDLELLKKEDYGYQYKWDMYDYIFVGASGIIASLTDYLLVKIPKEINYLGHFNQESPITAFLKKHINSDDGVNTWFSNWAKLLEKKCKVPYDVVKDGLHGMHPRTHRLQSLGHDPILGFIFGILDIYRGTLTGFSYDKLTNLHTLTIMSSPSKNLSCTLIEALLIHIGHLVSDVGTTMGLPPPLFTLFQGINITDPLSISSKDRTIGQLARWMYLNGYDLRHFIAMGITPAVIEIILRTFLMCRHYAEHGEVEFSLTHNPKYRNMLLCAHAVACASNAGKITLMQGNPLAINYNEWLALFRYLIPSVKYWLFDKTRLKLEHMKKINENGWQELLKTGDKLLETSYIGSLEMIQLGINPI